MISIDFTPQDIDALHHQRFHHPHPRVQLKMEAVYLKSQGLPHQEICRLTRISENTLRSYFYSSAYLETASQVTEYKELVYSCLVPSGRVAATINVSQVLNLQNVMSPAVLQVLL